MKTVYANEPQKIKINEEILEIIPLGAGSEVGRSCLYLQFMNKKIILDCGIHPAYNGLSSLPYFDMINIEEIDLLLITHFHLDHCGALPYFLSRTSFKGECYMTHPTKSIYQHLLSDYIKVSHVRTEESLYDDIDLEKSLKIIKTVDFKQTVVFKDSITFTAFAAGHVLGAAMFLIEIGGVKILYTGDFSRENDRHLQPADIPNSSVNILIIESTYGIHKHDPRAEREAFFLKYVSDIVRNGGKCLLPVMVSGRAQELLLILEEYWEKSPDLKNIRIFYISSLAKKCMDIFKSYINIMGDAVKKKYLHDGSKNPFDFNFITSVKNMEEIYEYGYKDDQPVVVFASPGMLQNGLSRDLFDKWCENPINGVIITGYCVEGTLARYLMSDPKEVELSTGRKVKLSMKVKSVTFSAHSDFQDTSNFIDKIKPKKIVLVHGEGKEMKRLKDEMDRINQQKTISGSVSYEQQFTFPRIYNPQNCQKIQFHYKINKIQTVYITGDLYNYISNNFPLKQISQLSEEAKDNEITTEEDDNFIEFNGIICNNMLLSENNLNDFTNQKSIKLKNCLKLTFIHNDKIYIITALKRLYNLNMITFEHLKNDYLDIKIFNNEICLEWYSSIFSDRLADSVAFFIHQLNNYPSSRLVKEYTCKNIDYMEIYKNKLIKYLDSKYFLKRLDNILNVYDNNVFKTKLAEICLDSFDVKCQNEIFKETIEDDLRFFEEYIS